MIDGISSVFCRFICALLYNEAKNDTWYLPFCAIRPPIDRCNQSLINQSKLDILQV